MKIGVLALQGAFIEHINVLKKLGVDTFEIRQLKDIETSFDGLILPGGESTTMGKLLKDLQLFEPLKSKIEAGLPTFGTCAGMILLAKKVEDNPTHFGTMDIAVKRNAYGRQLGSFLTEENFEGIGEIPMSFIRAPYIESVGPEVKVLSIVNDNIVAAQQGNMLATSFHPEITHSTLVHEYFVNIVAKSM